MNIDRGDLLIGLAASVVVAATLAFPALGEARQAVAPIDCLFSSIMQSPIIAAVITTVFGGLIVFFWQRAQKRKELAVETLEQFQRLYGEFFCVVSFVGRL